MSSSSYRIDWDTLSNGGSDDSSSATYQLRDTIGNAAIGSSDSASYQLRSGYREGLDDLLLSFSVFPQVQSSGVNISSLIGTTVTPETTTGFSVGDFAVVIQDVGPSQVSAVGQITSIVTIPPEIVFDTLTDNGTAPVIDGTDDQMFLLEGDSISFGEMTDEDFGTGVIGFEATVVSENGYSVQILDDGDLRDGSDAIDDVSDGTVTLGSEEYGARSSDTTIATSTFDTQDTAITTTPQAISTTSTAAYSERNFVTLKSAVASNTPDGTYAQVLTLIITGNY